MKRTHICYITKQKVKMSLKAQKENFKKCTKEKNCIFINISQNVNTKLSKTIMAIKLINDKILSTDFKYIVHNIIKVY